MLLLVTVSSSFSVLVDFEEWSSGHLLSGGLQIFIHHSRARGLGYRLVPSCLANDAVCVMGEFVLFV
jgi:hypothetical protein